MDWDDAYAARERGDLDRAIRLYDKVMRAGGLSSWQAAVALTERGVAYLDKDRLDGSCADFDAALEHDPEHALAFANRAIAYHRKDDYVRAVADYDEAIRLDPNDPDTYRNRGLALYHQKKYDKTIADDDRAIELRPDFADAYYDRGRAQYNLDDTSKALADFSAVIRIEKDSADAFAWRGFVHDDRKDAGPGGRGLQRSHPPCAERCRLSLRPGRGLRASGRTGPGCHRLPGGDGAFSKARESLVRQREGGSQGRQFR